VVAYLCEAYKATERRSCRLIRFSRTSNRYWRRGKDDRALVVRLKELAGSRPRYVPVPHQELPETFF
jgi:hypothetical protein